MIPFVFDSFDWVYIYQYKLASRIKELWNETGKS